MPTDTIGDPVAPVPSAPAPTDEELARELFELEKQFPPSERAGLLADARWYEENATALYERYKGTHVAIMNGAVVGHGWNELQLRLDMSRKYHLHPDGFLVVYVLPSVFE